MKTSYEVVTLAACCAHFSDGDWIETKDQSPEGIRLIQTGNIGEGEYKDKADRARYVSSGTFDRLRCTEVLAGDCLISRLPEPVGRACIVPDSAGRMITGVDCSVVRFDAGRVLPRYFVYYTQSDKYLAAVNSATTGTTRSRISRKNLGDIPVPVPPLQEQQRIVAVLDEVFEGIAVVTANTTQNAESARQTAKAQLDRVFRYIEDSAHGSPLASVGTAFVDGDWIESKDQSPNGIRLVQTGNIGVGVYKDRREKARFVSEPTFARLRCTEVVPGDCLVSRLPEPVGRACLIPSTGERMITGVDCTIIRFDQTRVLPEYFIYFSQTQKYLRSVASKTTGTTRNRISRSNLGQVSIPLVSIDEQRRTIDHLDSVFSDARMLEALYLKKAELLSTFWKSLLNEAFSGNL